MKNLSKILFASLLILLISGCGIKNITDPQKPKIDETLEMVDSTSLKSIPEINSIGLEWKKVDDPRVVGYNIYRANLNGDGTKFQHIAFVKNKYATHYVDTKLEPNTPYNYFISTGTKDDIESKPTEIFKTQTLPTLEPVSFIQAISNMPRQIKLLWRPHDSQRVESYIIERTSPNTAKWEELERLDGRLHVEYIDEKLEDNVVYLYKVTAVAFDDVLSLPSETVRAQTRPLPLPATNIQATTNLPRKITLNWEPSQTEGVVEYRIYNSNSADGKFSHLASSSSSNLTFEDMVNEDGKHKFYKIAAVDKDNLESALIMNATMGATLPKLNKPIITLAQIQGEKVILNWLEGDSRARSYVVYKKIKQSFLDSERIKINGITDLRFEDKDIIRGVEYIYTLQSVDEFGITSIETEEVSLTLPKLSEN